VPTAITVFTVPPASADLTYSQTSTPSAENFRLGFPNIFVTDSALIPFVKVVEALSFSQAAFVVLPHPASDKQNIASGLHPLC